MTTLASALIAPADLAVILDRPDVKMIDATYGQPPATVGIGQAVNFDIDLIADLSAPLAHTIPSPESFAQAVGNLGIGNDDHVIVYDHTGMAFAAARVWWMFRLFGHNKVQVLNGGLPAWRQAGFDLQAKQALPPKTYTASYRPELFKRYDDMLANVSSGDFTVLDARDPRRFSGSMAEPRPGMAAGHIPGSANVFFGSLINPADGMLQPPAALNAFFADSQADLSKPITCSCGSGVTAGVVALALYEIGHTDAAIYGGSWSEWANTPGAPVATAKE